MVRRSTINRPKPKSAADLIVEDPSTDWRDSSAQNWVLEAEACRRVDENELGKYQRCDARCTNLQQAMYEVLRDKGMLHVWAQMVALKQTPGEAGTDRLFMVGNNNNNEFDTMAPDMRDFYLGRAKEAGVNVRGKRYVMGLATEPGDPRAWVDNIHDVKSRCEQEGWGCEGAVKVKNKYAD